MDQYISQILDLPFSWAPEGTLPCDGKTINIQQNAALYSLIGTYYGGDGVNNFALPDLRPVDENGHKRPWAYNEIHKVIVVNGIYPMRP